MNKDLKNNVEIEQDEYGTAYTDPGDVKDNVFAQAMEQSGIGKIKETMREATVVMEQTADGIKEKFSKGSLEYQATVAFQEEVLKSLSALRRDLDNLQETVKDQHAMYMLAQKNAELLKQEQEKARRNIGQDFKGAIKNLKEKAVQAKDVTIDKFRSGISYVREAAEKTLENVHQFRIEKEHDVLRAADRGILKQKEIMLSYNRQMAQMHENVKDKLVEIQKSLEAKAKDFSVAKEAVKNLFRKSERKVDSKDVQDRANLFSKLSDGLSVAIGAEWDARNNHNEKAADIEKEMEDIRDKWQTLGEDLDRQGNVGQIDIEESKLDRDDERYGDILAAADQMLEKIGADEEIEEDEIEEEAEVDDIDDHLKSFRDKADEINQQAQDNNIDRDVDRDYGR